MLNKITLDLNQPGLDTKKIRFLVFYPNGKIDAYVDIPDGIDYFAFMKRIINADMLESTLHGRVKMKGWRYTEVWADEEGLMKHLPVNEYMTGIYRQIYEDLDPEGFLVGTIVLMRRDEVDGDR